MPAVLRWSWEILARTDSAREQGRDKGVRRRRRKIRSNAKGRSRRGERESRRTIGRRKWPTRGRLIGNICHSAPAAQRGRVTDIISYIIS